RQRWLGTRACRRRLLLRGRVVGGGRSLFGMLFLRLGRKGMGGGLGALVGGGLPATRVRQRAVVLVCLRRRAHGKIAARGLPAPQVRASAVRLARNPREELLCALFAEVLGLERVGIDDNFFALGGDSIVSIQLVSRARKVGLAITPRAVFEHQTVAGLAGVA